MNIINIEKESKGSTTEPRGTPQVSKRRSLGIHVDIFELSEFDLVSRMKITFLSRHESHSIQVYEVRYYDQQAFFKSIKTPHEKNRLSIFVCIAFTISRIVS